MPDEQPQEVAAVARLGCEARHDPQQDAVGGQDVTGQQAERETACIGQERDLDVVHEDADRDAGVLAGAVQDEAVMVWLGHAAQLRRHESAGRGRVAECPEPGQHGRCQHQRPGGEQRPGALCDRLPVAVGEIGAQRSAPRTGAVDERPRAHDERLHPARDGVVAEAAASVREVGGRFAIARSEPQHLSGGEAVRPPARARREARELVPGGPARSRKRIRMHDRRCSSPISKLEQNEREGLASGERRAGTRSARGSIRTISQGSIAFQAPARRRQAPRLHSVRAS